MTGFFDEDLPPDIDTEVFSVARLYDFLLGGHHNFAADRALGRELLATEPNGSEILLENRRFLARALRFMLDQGIRQFLDLGSGIPTQSYVHEVAHRTHPEARVVYVDNDAPAVSHSNYILRDDPNSGAILADARNPEGIVGDPVVKSLIDFNKPVGLLALAVLHFLPMEDDAAGIVARYRDALAPGSYFALTHATTDGASGALVESVQEIYHEHDFTATPRSHEQLTEFFDGFEIVEPGLVLLPLWRPDPTPPPLQPEEYWFYAGVGKKR
jgi:S-adenosyl methyltransferase